jgi:hypothetical protein
MNHNDAVAGLAASPVSELSLLQGRALQNAAWAPDTYMDLLLLGPPGTGKSTQARRIAPRGSAVIVPTNELMNDWTARMPGAVVLTLDQALANVRLLRTAPAIIIDEVFRMPAVHVVSFCSQGVPVVALGCYSQTAYAGPLGLAYDPSIVPVDHIAVMRTVHRYGADILNTQPFRAILPRYTRNLNLPAQFQFVSAFPGRVSIQRVLAQRAGQHMTCHRLNTTIVPGTRTVAVSQGLESDDVYLHLFNNDEAYYTANAEALLVAITRHRNTLTITAPPRRSAALTQWINNNRLPVVNRPNNPQNPVFGSFDNSTIDNMHPVCDNPTDEAEVPKRILDDYRHPTKEGELDYDIVRSGDAILADMSPAVVEAMFEVHFEPPNPAVLQDRGAFTLRKPDPAVRITVGDWHLNKDFHEPTILPHIGYPFSNSEEMASIYAIFDRYTKPQNVDIKPARAFQLADVMFDRWRDAFIDSRCQVSLPTVGDLFANWRSKRNCAQLALIARSLREVDTSELVNSTYFLKAQAKPKFGAYGHSFECGQGILAMSKSINAANCPLMIGAVKAMQGLFKSHVIYDSGLDNDGLDAAVAACTKREITQCLSLDLSQQDSSHMIVHRLFIAKVLTLLGFPPETCMLYLLSREKRRAKGMSLNVSFYVFERLFSGEPGTAFFNFLMSTGTTAATYDLSNCTMFIGKGDDNTVVPVPKRLVSAVSILRETGVVVKPIVTPYLDFANRIWTSSGRSFSDPVRLMSKFTCRLSNRHNSEAEFTAFRDYSFTPDIEQAEELKLAVAFKHGISAASSHVLVEAAVSLREPDTFFSLLRPSKVPAARLPVHGHCCGHEVVYEDLEDQCMTRAIAFIADVRHEEVLESLNQIRASRPACMATTLADMLSKHRAPTFVSLAETKALCQVFGVPYGRSVFGLGIHTCRGHAKVVRASGKVRVQGAWSLFGGLPRPLNWAWAAIWYWFNLPPLLAVPITFAACFAAVYWVMAFLVRTKTRIRPPKPATLLLRHQPTIDSVPAIFGGIARRAKDSLSAKFLVIGLLACVQLLQFSKLHIVVGLLDDAAACGLLGDELAFASAVSMIIGSSFVVVVRILIPIAALEGWLKYRDPKYSGIFFNGPFVKCLLNRLILSMVVVCLYTNWTINMLWECRRNTRRQGRQGRRQAPKNRTLDCRFKWLENNRWIQACFKAGDSERRKLAKLCHPDKIAPTIGADCARKLSVHMFRLRQLWWEEVPFECCHNTTTATHSSQEASTHTPGSTATSRSTTSNTGGPGTTSRHPISSAIAPVKLRPSTSANAVTTNTATPSLHRTQPTGPANTTTGSANAATNATSFPTAPQASHWTIRPLAGGPSAQTWLLFLFVSLVFIMLWDLILWARQQRERRRERTHALVAPGLLMVQLAMLSNWSSPWPTRRSNPYRILFRRRQRLLTWPAVRLGLPATADLGVCLQYALAVSRPRVPVASWSTATEAAAVTMMTDANTPTQLELFNMLRRVPNPCTLDWVFSGIAGCGKTTAYLQALAYHPLAVVVVPSNALANELRARLATAGLVNRVFTQHVALLNTDPAIPCIIDEVFALPEYHVGRIASLYSPCVGVGDRSQITDPGFILPPSLIRQPSDRNFLRSYTVPLDAMAIAHQLRIVDPMAASWSARQLSVFRAVANSVLPDDGVTRLSFANECANGTGQTVFTFQGQRAPIVVLHACQRDMAAMNMPGFMWSALSRHTELLVLDWAPQCIGYWHLEHVPEYDDPIHTVPY